MSPGVLCVLLIADALRGRRPAGGWLRRDSRADRS